MQKSEAIQTSGMQYEEAHMAELVSVEDARLADDALKKMGGWDWGYTDSAGCIHSYAMELDAVLNRLAYCQNSDPARALLTLLIQGRVTASGDFRWRRYQAGREYELQECATDIAVERWAMVKAALAVQAEQNALEGWPLACLNLHFLNLTDVDIAEWQPELNRCSYAMRASDIDLFEATYFEEHFIAEGLMVRPKAVAGDEQSSTVVESEENYLTAPNLELTSVENRGRRPKYDWPAASIAVFGEIHRGDFKPSSQADVERALIAHLSDADGGPSESTVRPFAKLIWEESLKA